MTEIVALEQLLSKTKVTSDKHVTTARRLAHEYNTLEDLKNEALRSEKLPEPQRIKSIEIAQKARSRAIELYRMIIQKHEDYPKLDEVIYALGLTYQTRPMFESKGEERTAARATYLELVRKRPQSLLVTEAYLQLGALFFEDAVAGQGSWNLPLEAYQRVLDSCSGTAAAARPGCNYVAHAGYRLGFCYWHLSDVASAKARFRAAITATAKQPNLWMSSQISADATKALQEL